MKFFRTKKTHVLHAAKFFALAAVGISLVTPPAFAAQYYYTVPSPSTSEITGDLWTNYFNAKIHLVEYNTQLLLSKVVLDGYSHQYISEAYPIEFNFQGKGWHADLITPIHMAINNSFRPDGSYESVIRANVNFTMTEFGQTITRPGLATLHLVQSQNWNRYPQTLSLEIIDDSDANTMLYNSGTNLTMDHGRNALTSLLPLVSGRFDAQVLATANTNYVYYPTYGYNYQPYAYPSYPISMVWPNAVAVN
jgi:hypothetical protein